MQNESKRIVLKFNEFDFRHRKVLEILHSKPRNKTEMVVNAILHYVSCPEASEEFNKESIKKLIREVIADMQQEGLVLGTPTPADPHGDDDLGDMMAAFRMED